MTESSSAGAVSRGRHRVQRYSITWTILAALLLVGVVPLGLYSLITIKANEDQIETTLRQRHLDQMKPARARTLASLDSLNKEVESLVDNLELYIASPPSGASVWEPALGGTPCGSDDRINPALRHVLFILERGYFSKALSDHIVDINFAFNGCTTVYDTHNPGVFGEAQMKDLGDAILQVQQEIAATGEAPQGGPFPPFPLAYLDRNGLPQPTMVVGRPVYSRPDPENPDARYPVGSLVLVVRIPEVQDVLARMTEDSDTGGSFILQGRKNYFADAKPEFIHRRNLTDADAWVSDFFKGEDSNSRNIFANKDGRRWLVTSGPLGDAPLTNGDWRMFLVEDSEPYFATVSALRSKSLLFIGGAVAMVIFAAVFVAKRVARPIQNVTAAALQLSSGDFSAKAPVESRDEIGEMAHTFNVMSDEISRIMDELKRAAEENKALFLDSIRAIANALDAKDPYTRGHSERVSIYAKTVARELGFDGDALLNIEIAGLLHDIGKIGIQDRILLKPAQLTEAEFKIMKTHPEKSAYILQSIRRMENIIPGVKHHHERWSGGGYPDGLKGEEIPVEARIVGVADTLDAMTTDRPYQKAFTFEAAAARVNELCPAVYDERVVEAFNRAFKKGTLELVAEKYKRQQVRVFQNA